MTVTRVTAAPDAVATAPVDRRPGWRQRLKAGAFLFPPVEGPRRQRSQVLALMVGAAVATGILLVRQNGPGALDVVYAEDGRIFLLDGLGGTLRSNLLEPYAGYAHVVPRLLAEPIAELPLERSAAAFAVTACVATALMAALLFRSLAGHIQSTTLRTAAAASLVVLPAGQEEVFDTVTNLHWFLVPVAAVLLLWNPRSRAEVVVAAAVVFLAAASDPMTVVLVPVALLRLGVLTPRARAWIMPAALGSGLALQAVVVVGGGDTRDPLTPVTNPVKLGAWWIFDVPGRGLGGSRWVEDIDDPISWIGVGVALAAVSVVVVLCLRTVSKRELVVPAVLVLEGALLYLAYAGLAGIRPPRYGVPGAILLIIALAVALDRLRSAPLPRWAGRAAVVGAIGFVAVIAVNLRVDNTRTPGPSWSEELDRARSTCRSTAAGPGDLVTIQIPPAAVWRFSLPCGDVDPAS